MTQATDLDLSQYEGKKVIVTVKPSGEQAEATEVEGLAESSNELGILIKPRGKAMVEIIEASNIIEVKLAPEKAKNLTTRYVPKLVEGEGKARQHLLTSHGQTLTTVNSMTEEQAFAAHAGIDHSDLGHVHGEKPAKSTPEASASE